MALGSINITMSEVRDYIQGVSYKVSELVATPGLNKYSFYAPGQLDVDANKDPLLIPPTANFKLGDFRLYDKLATAPAAASDFTYNWGPGGVIFNAVIPWFPGTMNLKSFASPGDYVTMKFYTSTANGTAETNAVLTYTSSINFNSITPLVSHSRTTTFKAEGTQLVSVSGIPTGYSTLYVDTYISDIGGGRLINLGTKTNGYTTLTLVENNYPHVSGQNTNNPAHPAGYTVIFPNVFNTVKCIMGGMDQSIGTSYSFNVVAYAVNSGGNRTVRLSSVDVILTVDGIRTTLQAGLELPSAGKSFSGTLADGSAWNYNDMGYVTFENAVLDLTDTQLC